MGHPIAAADLRHALPVDAVLHDEDAPLVRHQRRDHAFDSGGARAGDEYGGPLGGIQVMRGQQAAPGLVLQIVKIILPVTQVRLQQAPAHPFGQGHGSRIEEQHHASPLLRKWLINRDFTSTGLIDGRGRSAGLPGRVSSRAKRAPSSGLSSSHDAMRVTSSVSSDPA